MAEHKWSLLCHRGVVDKHSNLLSILDVTDEITIELLESIPENAVLPVQLQLVSVWQRVDRSTPETFWCTFTIDLPNGDVFESKKQLEGKLQTHGRTRLIFGIQGIPFVGAGLYIFNVMEAATPDSAYEVAAKVSLEIKMKAEVAMVSATEFEQPAELIPSAPPASSSPPEPSHPSGLRASPKRRRRGSS